MIPYRELEHTADIGLEIYGGTINELFLNGVKGLFHFISPELEILTQPKTLPGKKRLTILELSALSKEELLIHWLNEFIYSFFVKKVFPKIIKINEISEKNLRAEVDFSKYSEALKISTEVKAATYHNISIRKFDSKYQARVIFDV